MPEDDSRPSVIQGMLAACATPARQYRVLVVDDSEQHLVLIKALLESQGYIALTAQTGVDAVRLYNAERPDAVVLDYQMPDLDGAMVAERIKFLGPATPILMFSGDETLPRTALRHVDALVKKGESPLLLLRAIAAIVGK